MPLTYDDFTTTLEAIIREGNYSQQIEAIKTLVFLRTSKTLLEEYIKHTNSMIVAKSS